VAVVSVEEEYLPQSGTWTKDGWQYVRSWVVTTDSESDRVFTVLSADGIPSIEPPSETYPEDENAVCTDLSCQCFQKHNTDEGEPGGGKWRVTANYSSYYEDVQGSKSPLYPTRPAAYHYHWQAGTQGVDYYFVGGEKRLLKNLAGCPYVPAVEKLITLPRLDIMVNLAEEDLPDAGEFHLKTNSDTYFGYSAGKARVLDIDAQGPQKEHNIEFYAVRISIEFDPRGFDPIVLEAGLSELKSGKLIPIRENGAPITDPLPLKEDGDDVVVIPPEDMGNAPESGGPTFRVVEGFYEQTSFADLVF